MQQQPTSYARLSRIACAEVLAAFACGAAAAGSGTSGYVAELLRHQADPVPARAE